MCQPREVFLSLPLPASLTSSPPPCHPHCLFSTQSSTICLAWITVPVSSQVPAQWSLPCLPVPLPTPRSPHPSKDSSHTQIQPSPTLSRGASETWRFRYPSWAPVAVTAPCDWAPLCPAPLPGDPEGLRAGTPSWSSVQRLRVTQRPIGTLWEERYQVSARCEPGAMLGAFARSQPLCPHHKPDGSEAAVIIPVLQNRKQKCRRSGSE